MTWVTHVSHAPHAGTGSGVEATDRNRGSVVQQSQHQQVYRHVGYVMDDREDVTTLVGPFLQSALAAGEPVVLACPDAMAGHTAANVARSDSLIVSGGGHAGSLVTQVR